MKKLNSILLIDDNTDDNFFHVREIRKFSSDITVISKNSGQSALEYLASTQATGVDFPDLVFLDINMPGINGWEFLQEYNRLYSTASGAVIIIMLTTSSNPDDREKAKNWEIVSDYKTKPLTKELLQEVAAAYFEI